MCPRVGAHQRKNTPSGVFFSVIQLFYTGFFSFFKIRLFYTGFFSLFFLKILASIGHLE